MPRNDDAAPAPRRPSDRRVPPHDLQAEESLLGAMMLEPEAIAVAAGVVRTDDFYKPAHAHIFDAIHALYAAGQPVDPVTVADELRRAGLLDIVGGHQALVQIMSSTPATTNAAGYARIIEEHSLLRRLIAVAGEIAELGYEMPDDVTKALDRAESLVYEVNQRRVTDTTAKIEELLGLNLDRLEQLYGQGDAITGIPTGYADLDELLSGLQPSNLIVVGARPAMGKALALDTSIPTPSGWTTMGEIEVGDRVFDDKGQPCTVTYVSPVQEHRPCYDVEFDDGSIITADADHQWLAGRGPDLRVITTGEMFVESDRSGDSTGWWVPRAGPLGLPPANLPVDPFTLGRELAQSDQALSVQRIPASYLRASISQRRALLEALAGGCVAPQSFASADADLVDQVCELVSSLGFRMDAVSLEAVSEPDGTVRKLWRVSWSEPTAEAGRAIRAIRPRGSVPVRCITVDSPTHLYLAGRTMIPTHNTAFALGMAAYAALHGNHPVLLFSLEMGNLELSQRMLCSEARIDSVRVRTGRLSEDDWNRISQAIGQLAAAPIWIDDNPNVTVMEIRAKARRLRSQVGSLGMVVVDYLQLMTGRGSAENRQVEVSEMSRGLKILARELECPVVALSQLSRQLEMRADKRPMLADLRESGCLTADARVLRADTGAEVTIGELAASGERDIPVWSLDTDLRMVPATMTHAFPTGEKEVFELQLASGRQVAASANHPFLTVNGWLRLDELAVGSRIAVPRAIPAPKETSEWPEHEVVLLAHLLGDGCYQPSPVRLARGRRNPIAAWLDQWGLYGRRSHEKFVPPPVFALTDEQVALFLRHLWATDGCIGWWGQGRIYYASTSRRLVDDVRILLLRLGIRSTLRTVKGSIGRPGYQLHIDGWDDQMRFLDEVGVIGEREKGVVELRERLTGKGSNTNVDTIPVEVWNRVRSGLSAQGITTRRFAAELGTAYCGSALYKHAPSRTRLARVAEIVDDDILHALAASDVFWDRITAIEPMGAEPVFDATVDETHNFISNGIVLSNSIEQDADVVMFIYRDDVYHPDSPDRGQAEVIVAKHRNGPTGVCRLAFLEQFTRFANMARID